MATETNRQLLQWLANRQRDPALVDGVNVVICDFVDQTFTNTVIMLNYRSVNEWHLIFEHNFSEIINQAIFQMTKKFQLLIFWKSEPLSFTSILIQFHDPHANRAQVAGEFTFSIAFTFDLWKI